MEEGEESLIKFETPTTCLLSGATGVGKSWLIYKILKHAEGMFTTPPKKIIYCYGVYQELYDEMQRNIPNIEFYNRLPSRDDLDSWNVTCSRHKGLILDDLLQRAAKNANIVDLFCQYSHHMNFTTFFVVQNLFADGIQCISLNTHYFLVMKQLRDQPQIKTLGRQIMPGDTSYFMSSFKQVTHEKYSYLLIDLSPHSQFSEYKLRSNILPGQLMNVYLPESTK